MTELNWTELRKKMGSPGRSIFKRHAEFASSRGGIMENPVVVKKKKKKQKPSPVWQKQKTEAKATYLLVYRVLKSCS